MTRMSLLASRKWNAPLRAVLRPLADLYYSSLYFARRRSLRYLFILGHMRSGSTLLVHVLNTNRDVFGRGENYLTYRSAGDLRRLVCKNCRALRKTRLRERYVMDKVLHDWLPISPRILSREDCRLLFLIREPVRSIASMMTCYPDWFSGRALPPESVREKATKYYTSRLKTLQSYAETRRDPSGAMFLTHDQLVNDTQRVFGAVESWLGLSEPLSETYDLHWSTGASGIGDSSENIRSGRIVREERPLDFAVTPEMVPEAIGSFDACCSAMRRQCGSVTTSSP